MTPPEDVVWLDDENGSSAPDEELADAARPALPRRTKIILLALAAVVLAAVVIVGVTVDDHEDSRVAEPSASMSSMSSMSSASSTPAPPLRDDVTSVDPPAQVVAAVRTVFPSATVTSFLNVQDADGSGTSHIYNLHAGHRLITISVAPPRRTDVELVNRTATSFEIAQRLGRSQVDILLRTDDRSTPTASDYAGLQQLVQDGRLLATR